MTFHNRVTCGGRDFPLFPKRDDHIEQFKKKSRVLFIVQTNLNFHYLPARGAVGVGTHMPAASLTAAVLQPSRMVSFVR